MRYCPQCGAQLPADARFCTQCGAKVEAPDSTLQGTQAQPLDTPTVIAPNESEQTDAPTAPPASVQPPQPEDDATHIAPNAQTYNPLTEPASRGSLSEQFAANSTPQQPQPPQHKGLGEQFADAQPSQPAPAPHPGLNQPETGAHYWSAPPQYGPPQNAGPHMGGPQPWTGAQFQPAGGPPQNVGGPQPGIGAQFSGASAPFPQGHPQTTQTAPWDEQQNSTPAINFGAFDWRTNLPGLIRLGCAFLLVFTSMFVWWRFQFSYVASTDNFPVYSNVFALIGCLGVMASIITQIAIHPSLLGKSLNAKVRLAIRSGLLVPALFAILLEAVTGSSSNVPGPGVVMLALATGLTLHGLDDTHELLPDGIFRIIGLVLSGIATLLAISYLIGCFVKMNSWNHVTAVLIPNALLTIGLCALTVFSYVKYSPRFLRLATALTAALTVSYLFGTWAESDRELAANFFEFDGAALIVLVLALALARAPKEESEPSAAAWTSWVPMAFFVAASAALIQLCDFVGLHLLLDHIYHEELGYTSMAALGGPSTAAIVWSSVMMLLIAGGYIAVGILVHRSPMTRLLAIGITSFAILAVLITLGLSQVYQAVGTAMLGYVLWLPLFAVLALTVPKSVRDASGSLIPTSTSKPDAVNMPH